VIWPPSRTRSAAALTPYFGAVSIVAVVLSSALVSGVVGGLVAYLSQRSLATRAARLDYEYAAKKRLYEAVGPLRFQLVVAARDLASRVDSHRRSSHWVLAPDGYYVHSFLYRLLRPLAIGVLVERTMSYADFSVDPSSVDLLRFDRAAYRMLTGADPFLGADGQVRHDGLDWGRESQHIFRDNLRSAAMCLLGTGAGGRQVVIDYAEFKQQNPDPLANDRLAGLARLFQGNGGSLTDSPVFWLRLVGYGYVCRAYVERHGSGIGIAVPDLDVAALLAAAADDQITSRLTDYPATFDRVLAEETV
jgi:hypothetical protein